MDSEQADKQDVRLRRLMQLRATYPELKDKEFAEELGITSADYFSRLKSYPKKGSKRIGDQCRDWETKLGLPVGWFDQDGDAADPAPPRHRFTPEALRIAEAYDDMDRPGRLKMLDYVAKIQREKAEELLAAATKKRTG